jgi:hypothetical protein
MIATVAIASLFYTHHFSVGTLWATFRRRHRRDCADLQTLRSRLAIGTRMGGDPAPPGINSPFFVARRQSARGLAGPTACCGSCSRGCGHTGALISEGASARAWSSPAELPPQPPRTPAMEFLVGTGGFDDDGRTQRP